jgi:hypothetical protein
MANFKDKERLTAYVDPRIIKELRELRWPLKYSLNQTYEEAIRIGTVMLKEKVSKK